VNELCEKWTKNVSLAFGCFSLLQAEELISTGGIFQLSSAQPRI
jgi:hypothetical protein